MEFFVGTFNLPIIYTLRLDLERTSLRVVRTSHAVGPHSWLALSHDRSNLYATAWTTPPSVAAYRVDTCADAINGVAHVDGRSPGVELLNTAPVASLSGYVAVSRTHLYSAGGPSGEVFALDARTGAIAAPVQTLSFVDDDVTGGPGAPVADKHGAFGGLRHGAHSVDLSPDGRLAYVADIGRNCVWSFGVARGGEAEAGASEGALVRRRRHPAPRAGDGPRHAWPHPHGRVVYVVQEHSSVVDAYAVSYEDVGGRSGGASGAAVLTWMGGVRIIPAEEDAARYWADEVRLSTAPSGAHAHAQADGDAAPRWLFASTRGLARETRGWVAVVELDAAGGFVGAEARCLYRTRTSGGIANAIQPALQGGVGGAGAGVGAGAGAGAGAGTVLGRWVDVLALTDSEEGWVCVLGWDGEEVREVAALRLEAEGEGEDVVKAATAVWL